MEQFAFLYTVAKAVQMVRAGTPVVHLPFRLNRTNAEIIVLANSSFFRQAAPSSEDAFDFVYVQELEMGAPIVLHKRTPGPSFLWRVLKNEVPELAAR
jgi:hypothetical protein